jgi:hypothetical protein
MNYKQLALALSLLSCSSLFCRTNAEINTPAAAHSTTTTTTTATATTTTRAGISAPEAAYRDDIARIHKAMRADQLPSFAHSSPLNKIKLADSRYQEREVLSALKEMTPHNLKAEGKYEWNNRTVLFFEGDPELATKNSEYFPVIAEMVKEDGLWKLSRQQSWHVKSDSLEAQIIPKGQARVKRFEDLMSALKRPIPANQRVIGEVAGKPFKTTGVYFMPRDSYCKIMFADGRRQFSIYVREELSFADLQNRHILITPLDGYEADLMPETEMFGPICAKIDFGKVDAHGYIPGTISLAIRTPETVNLCGNFSVTETADCLTPDDNQKAK